MLLVPRSFVTLKILQYIATCPGEMAKKREIAKAISAPVPYTGKIIHELLLAGFIKSFRGRQGGYTLALPASSIRVGDVVRFVDETRSWRTKSSFDDAGMDNALKRAQHKFFCVLNKHSIADLRRN